MNQVLKRPPAAKRLDLDDVQHIVLEDVSWELYEKLRRETDHRPIRITYDEGRLEMMSPLPGHENVKQLIHDFVRALAIELDLEMACLGGTTFRKREKMKAVEPDDCYYFKQERKMRGRKRLDLKRDPAPELVVEIDVTRSSVEREPIYAALGVPEIWRWDGLGLKCLHLTDGRYSVREKSLVFPFLSPSALTAFVKLRARVGENGAIRRFIKWVRKQDWPKHVNEDEV